MNAGAGAGVSEDAGGLSGGVCGEDEGNKGICPFAGETGSGEMTFVASFQRVEAPQRLQKRITPSLVAQMSASMPVSSIFSSVLQELQAREQAEFAFEQADGGELEAPEINFWIDERDAVGVDAIVTAELAHHTNFRFFVVFRPAEDELLFGREFVG